MSVSVFHTTFAKVLPFGDDYLPWFIFFLGSVALFSSVSAYFPLISSQQMYSQQNGRQAEDVSRSAAAKSTSELITPLGRRLFATWTLLSAIVRFYAAHNLHVPAVYDVTMWTFVVVIGHFYMECMHYKTMGTAGNFLQLIPLTQAPIALVWMLWARGYYLGEQ